MVAQALFEAGFVVEFIDLCFEKKPLQRISEAIRKFSPDGIGISIRNIDNCDFLSPKSFLFEIKELTDFLKSSTSAPILIGGSGVSIMPLQVLQFLDLDYAVIGEGEVAAVRFFQSVTTGDNGSIPGLISRKEHLSDHNPAQAVINPVVPQIYSWLDTRRYLKLEPVLPVQGKRGCANRCLYCTYNRIEGGNWRLREAASVVEEISIAMRQTGAREFEFVDSIFNQPEGYLETLLEEILRRRLKATFRVSSLSPKGLTKGQVKLMEKAGITSLVVTPETASDVTLAALRKDFTEADINHAAELLSGSSIKALWCFLLGGPKENVNTLAKTIDFVNRHIGKKDSAFITTGIRIYPGTGLHELAIREGVVEESDSLLMPSFYFSPEITPQKARDTLRNGLSDLSRCIFLSDTRSSSLGPLRRMGTLLGLPGPFWRYADYMNRITGSGRIISSDWSPKSVDRK